MHKAIERSRIDHKGVRVDIHVERTADRSFGRADLFNGDAFMARLAIGAPGGRSPGQLVDELKAMAQGRIEFWAAQRGASVEGQCADDVGQTWPRS